jgi:osmotically-inducible protein OsmY
MRMRHFALLAVSVLPALTWAQAADNSKSNAARQNSADNSSIADGQSNTPQDLKLTQAIRRAVMADKSLSIDAQNVKIVTINGHVTLNGVVRRDAERSTIEAKAITAAGADNVVDAMKVAPHS